MPSLQDTRRTAQGPRGWGCPPPAIQNPQDHHAREGPRGRAEADPPHSSTRGSQPSPGLEGLRTSALICRRPSSCCPRGHAAGGRFWGGLTRHAKATQSLGSSVTNGCLTFKPHLVASLRWVARSSWAKAAVTPSSEHPRSPLAATAGLKLRGAHCGPRLAVTGWATRALGAGIAPPGSSPGQQEPHGAALHTAFAPQPREDGGHGAAGALRAGRLRGQL